MPATHQPSSTCRAHNQCVALPAAWRRGSDSESMHTSDCYKGHPALACGSSGLWWRGSRCSGRRNAILQLRQYQHLSIHISLQITTWQKADIRIRKTDAKVTLFNQGWKKSPFRWLFFSGRTWLVDFIGAKDDGSGGDNWSYKTCKAWVNLSPPRNQHQIFYFLSPKPQCCQSTQGKVGKNHD